MVFNAKRQLWQDLRTCKSDPTRLDVRSIDLNSLRSERANQDSLQGHERHSLTAHVASMLIRGVRDIGSEPGTETQRQEAIRRLVEVCGRDRHLRRSARRGIRRLLESSTWSADAQPPATWKCPYCGTEVANDGNGASRRQHLDTHPDELAVDADQGMPCSGHHIRAVRAALLECLAELLSERSFPNYRHFFKEAWPGDRYLELQARYRRPAGLLTRFFRALGWGQGD